VESVAYAEFRATVCDANHCWQRPPISEAGVTARVGAGWMCFLSERHFSTRACVGRNGLTAGLCDAVAVPRQANQRRLIFLELKTSGQYADAVVQIRACVRKILAFGIPANVALTAEIWHCREPKSTITGYRQEDVDGRTVFIRHRRSA
jgi:hypothetical protein